MIPRDTVQAIIDASRVDDVIDDFVALKKRGVNMIGLCPFHNEKSPSFTVSPSKGIYKCFGCGKGGNSVNFLMDHENLSYVDALRWLANKYNIEIEEKELTPEERQSIQLEESLVLINQFAQEFYEDQLFKTERGKTIGLSYFKDRGFRESTIKNFGLGFAPQQNDGFTKVATDKGYNIDYLKRLGLTSQYNKDFFRDRVIFPIHGLTGKVIAFAGRILVPNPKAPKYINSPETEIYHKSKVLYGAYQAKTAIRKQDHAIMVEGYTDVISLHQAGIENVVASSGTSLTVEQIRLIKRYSNNIKILYDGDAAGVKAALRGLDLVLEQDLNVKIVLLPEGEDPDSFVKKSGTTDFQNYLEEKAQDFILFKTNLLLGETKGDPIKKSEVIVSVMQSIARIPDPIKRNVYMKECSARMDVAEEALVSELNKIIQQRLRQREKERQREQRQKNVPPDSPLQGEMETVQYVEIDEGNPQRVAPAVGDEFQEMEIARLLIAGGDKKYRDTEQTIGEFVLNEIADVLEFLEHPTYTKIIMEAQRLNLNGEVIDSAHFINHPNQELASSSIELLQSPFEYSEGWDKLGLYLNQRLPEDNFDLHAESSLRYFKLRKVQHISEQNHEMLKKAKPEQIDQLLERQQQLNAIKRELAVSLGRVVLKG